MKFLRQIVIWREMESFQKLFISWKKQYAGLRQMRNENKFMYFINTCYL